MIPTQQALQLLHGPLQIIGSLSLKAGSVSCALRILGAIENRNGHVGSQIRSFADAAPLAIDRQKDARCDSMHQAGSSSAAAASTTAGAAADDSATAGAQDDRRNQNSLSGTKGELLKLAGLWVPETVYKSLSQQQKQQVLRWQRQYTNKIGRQPGSSHMSVMSLNMNQLQVFVALTTDASSSSSSSSSQDALQDSDSSSSSNATAQKRKHERQKEQRRRQQQEVQYTPQSTAFGFDFLTSPQLDGQSLVKLSSEPLIINLNTQLRNAAAAKNPVLVVNLFDSLIAKGMAEVQAGAAAAAAAAAQDNAQTEDQQQQQQQEPPTQGGFVLPMQYRPDHDALAAYCRALCTLEEQQSKQKVPSAGEDKYRPQPEATCSVDRAEQAAAFWGSSSMKATGFPVYLALLTAYRAAGENKKVIEVFNMLREANLSAVKHYRIYLTALQAAVAGQDFDTANELGRAFSSKEIQYTAGDYRVRLVYLYRALVRGAASLGRWEDAIYWLQEIINHDSLVVVAPINFLYVMKEAAAQKRMDVVRTMMGAVDQHLAQQGAEPLVYYEEELCYIIQSAGAVGDTALINTAWQRLLKDLHGKPNRQPLTQSTAGAVATRGLSRTPRVQGHPGPVAYGTVIRAYVESKQYGKALKYMAEMEEVYKGTLAASVYGGLYFFPTALETEADITAAFTALQQRKNAGEHISTTMMNVIARAIGRLGNTEQTGKVFEGYAGFGLVPDADSYNSLIESCKLQKRVTAIESLISYMSSKGVEPNAASYNLLLGTAVKVEDRRAVFSAVQRMLDGGIAITSRNAELTMNLANKNRDNPLRQLMREANEKQQLGLPQRLLWATSRLDDSNGERGSLQAQWQREQQQQHPRQERRPQAADVWRPNMQRSSSSSSEEQQQPQEGRWQQQQQLSMSALDSMFDRKSNDDSEAASSMRAGLRAALGGNENEK